MNEQEDEQMPYKDREQRRKYDAAYKRRQRAQGRTKKGVDRRLTAPEIEMTKDVCDLYKEIIAEAQSADVSSLTLEAKLRIKLRAVEIGLRLIETTNLGQRIAALEEQRHEQKRTENQETREGPGEQSSGRDEDSA